MQEFTSFGFYKARNDLKAGTYRVVEDDESTSIATVDQYGNVEWKSVADFEEYERQQFEDERWANDGMSLIFGDDEE